MNFTRRLIDLCVIELYDKMGVDPSQRKYKMSKTYEQLEVNWVGPLPLKPKLEFEDTARKLSTETMKHPEYYKWKNGAWELDSSKKQELKSAIETIYDLEGKNNVKIDLEDIGSNIDQSTSSSEAIELLVNAFRATTANKKAKKNVLASKTMAELITIYDSLT